MIVEVSDKVLECPECAALDEDGLFVVSNGQDSQVKVCSRCLMDMCRLGSSNDITIVGFVRVK